MEQADQTQDVFPVYSTKYRRFIFLVPLFLFVFWISIQASPNVIAHGMSTRQGLSINTPSSTNVSIRHPTDAIHINHSDNTVWPEKFVKYVSLLKVDDDSPEPMKYLLRHSYSEVLANSGTKYIVYDCSTARKGRCGGWSDRLSGIISTFIISLITNRHFMINHDIPCRLERYVLPHKLDWRMNESRIAHKTSKYYFYNCDERIRELFRHGDLKKYFSADVSYIRINWDYTVDFRLRTGIKRLLPWLLKFNVADLQKAILEFLFQQSFEIKHILKDATKRSVKGKTVCAHFRIGENPSLPHDRPRTNENTLIEIWNVLKDFDVKGYTIFILTDSQSVKRTARSRLEHFVYDTHKISHIDNSRNDCEGFRYMVLDFYILVDSLCDVMIVGQSGFSIKAAFMRNSSNGMYCMRRNSVIPCSRYTLQDVYPNWFRPFLDHTLPEYQLLV